MTVMFFETIYQTVLDELEAGGDPLATSREVDRAVDKALRDYDRGK